MPVAGEQGLAPCPDKPNCVSSLATNDSQVVEPITFEGNPQAAWQKLQEVVLAMKRTKLKECTDTYLHVTFRSCLFRFVDDLECLLVADENRIEIRSASRTGYSDMGVNRRRVERIREAFDAAVFAK